MAALDGSLDGSVLPGFEPVAEAFGENLRHELGAAVCVIRRGEAVVDLWGGAEWTGDTAVLTFSCTKSLLSACAALLADSGALELDSPVARYWPAFAQAGKESHSVRDLLSHRAGLVAPARALTLDDLAAWDPVVEVLAAQSPSWPLGAGFAYHPLTFGWLVGEVLRRITGLRPRELFHQLLAEPLGVDAGIGRRADWSSPTTSTSSASPMWRTGWASCQTIGPTAWSQRCVPAWALDLHRQCEGSSVAGMTTMRALEQPTLNGPSEVRLRTDVPVPAPGPGEILIRVGAAGVNFANVMQAYGTYDGGPEAPYLAGFEAAGEIVAQGSGARGLEPGTHVIGTGYGAFAGYMVMPAAGAAPVPAGWSDEQALGLVLNWATALAALRPLGRVVRGDTVLIHAAAGGVGQAAVRLAKHYGATVLATASPDKHEAVRALGADQVIDSRAADVLAGVGADLVLESAGGDTFRASLAAAKRVTGRVVVYGAAGGEAAVSNSELVFKHQIQLAGLHIGVLSQAAPDVFAELMTELGELIAAGVYPPGQPTVYDLADGPTALTRLEARATMGKLALRP
jgi:NADPH2:quinone reductase